MKEPLTGSPAARRPGRRGSDAPASRRRRQRGGTSRMTIAPRRRTPPRRSRSRGEDRRAADPSAAPDRRALHQRMPLLGAAHEVVVRRHDAGRDEDVVLERRVGGDVGVGLDLRQRADRACRSRPASRGRRRRRRRARRARARRPGRRRSRARRARAREDDRAGRDDRARAELEWRQRLSFRGRARREHRLLADDRVVEHLQPSPSTVPGRRPRSRRTESAAVARATLQLLERAHDHRAVARPLLAGRPHRRRGGGSARTPAAAARRSDLRAVDVAVRVTHSP